MKSLHQGRDSTRGNIHGGIIHGEKGVVKKVILERAVTFTVSLATEHLDEADYLGQG